MYKKHSYRSVSLKVNVYHSINSRRLESWQHLTACSCPKLLLPPSQNSFPRTKQREQGGLRATTDWVQPSTQKATEWLTKHRLHGKIARNKTRNEGRELGTWIRNSSHNRGELNIELLCNSTSSHWCLSKVRGEIFGDILQNSDSKLTWSQLLLSLHPSQDEWTTIRLINKSLAKDLQRKMSAIIHLNIVLLETSWL